MVTNNYRLEKK